jgi:hypothetical protein
MPILLRFEAFAQRQQPTPRDQGRCDTPQRRLQGGKQHPQAPSPPARPKPGKTLTRIIANHLHSEKGQYHPRSLRTATMAAPCLCTRKAAELQPGRGKQPPTTSGSTRTTRNVLRATSTRGRVPAREAQIRPAFLHLLRRQPPGERRCMP